METVGALLNFHGFISSSGSCVTILLSAVSIAFRPYGVMETCLNFVKAGFTYPWSRSVSIAVVLCRPCSPSILITWSRIISACSEAAGLDQASRGSVNEATHAIRFSRRSWFWAGVICASRESKRRPTKLRDRVRVVNGPLREFSIPTCCQLWKTFNHAYFMKHCRKLQPCRLQTYRKDHIEYPFNQTDRSSV